MNDIYKRIEMQLSFLNLKGLVPYYKEYADRASKKKLSYEEYLALLLDEIFKEKSARGLDRRISQAKFPFLKNMEEFDFSFQPSLNEKEILKFSSLDFISQKENLIFLGPPGVGKTHLSIALGLKSCKARYRVIFIDAKKLIEELKLAQKCDSLTEKLIFYSRVDLIIIDELGYSPISKEDANLLFQFISVRYEKGSLILTSNYNFNDWDKIFNDNIVASAIIDRLVHHSKIFFINGSSYRIKDKIRKQN